MARGSKTGMKKARDALAKQRKDTGTDARKGRKIPSRTANKQAPVKPVKRPKKAVRQVPVAPLQPHRPTVDGQPANPRLNRRKPTMANQFKFAEFHTYANREEILKAIGTINAVPEQDVREGFLRQAAQIARGNIARNLMAALTPPLDEIRSTQIMFFGERPKEKSDAQATWDEQVDTNVEQLFSDPDAAKLIGPGTLGIVSVDSQLHEVTRPKEIASQVAAAYLSNYLVGRSDAQQLAAIGIVDSDIAPQIKAIGDARNKATPTSPAQPVAPQYTEEQRKWAFDITRQAIAWCQGQGMNADALKADLEQAADDDAILAASSLARLGFGGNAVVQQAFKVLRAADKTGWHLDVFEGNMPDPDGVPYKLRRKAGDTVVTTAKPGDAQREPSAPQPEGQQVAAAGKAAGDNNMLLGVLTALKGAGMSDTDIGGMMGVSRTTVGNLLKGKGGMVPDDATKAKIKQELSTRAEHMRRALETVAAW